MRFAHVMLIVAVIAALAAWLLWPEERYHHPPSAPPPATPEPASPPMPEPKPDEPPTPDPATPPVEEPTGEPERATGVPLTGRVVDDRTGEPLPGARVRVERGGTRGGFVKLVTEPLIGETVADDRGEFRIEGVEPEVLVTVIATARGHGRVAKTVQLPRDPPETTSVEIRLPASGRVTGTVTLADGSPAAGARVYAVPADAPKSLLVNPNSRVASSDGRSWVALRGECDEKGAFVVDGLDLDAVYSVRAFRDGYGRSDVRERISPTDDEPEVRADLVLLKTGTLTVRVLGPDGGAPEEAALFLFGEGFPIRLEAGEPGVYVAADPPPGEYKLRVTSPGAVMQEMPVKLGASEDRRLEVRLDRGKALAGVLVDDRGEPIANQKIFVMRPWQMAGEIEPSEGKATTDAKGGFRIEGLRPGVHSLGLVLGKHYAPDDLRLTAPDEELRIVLPRKSAVRVLIRTPPGGPIPKSVGIRIVRFSAQGSSESGRSAEWNGGDVRLDGFAPGKGVVKIRVAGYLEVAREVEFQSGETLDLGEILLEKGLHLEGRIVDREGLPVAGAELAVGDTWTPTHRVVATGRDGRFVLEGLPRGESELEIAAEGFLPRTVEADLPVQDPPLTITLDRGGLVTVRTTNAEGKPAPATRLRWMPVGGTEDDEHSDRSDTDHRGTLEVRLPEGRWRFDVLDADWNPTATKTEVDVAEGGTAEITLAAGE